MFEDLQKGTVVSASEAVRLVSSELEDDLDHDDLSKMEEMYITKLGYAVDEAYSSNSEKTDYSDEAALVEEQTDFTANQALEYLSEHRNLTSSI